ncbi:BatD family protein [Pseudoxanthomonas daejeonensis]|uniref:Protein BatD n=1 Tax=Pseudoxanthomonas daejeonensis TaxID=266062 RepID=A0ABQ6Z4C6_9GAMM|nr:hypothetical protein CSC65_13865 [Pseudoxanthomonas daejeonensis]
MVRVAQALVAACAFAVPGAHAETRAWLDRGSVTQGEAVTLNIETDQRGVAPDYTPLQDDFSLGPPYRSAAWGQDRTLFGVALTPRRAGRLQVPALQVGAERTAPLALDASMAQAPVARGDVFLESRVDDPSPYVQQSVGLTLRLYYATPLLSGELTQDPPAGTALQRVGDDVQSSRQIGGRRYQVVERRYLLVPERSGPLALPPARFRGQGAGGFFDDLFGNGRNLSAESPAQTLQVRAQPDAAPQPWLPLRELRLRYLAAPDGARTGEAVEIAVEAVAQGATSAQFPEIPVPQVEGAQVFAERAETTERFVDGGPQLTAVRRFSVVPLRPGPLRVAGPRMDWWDTTAGQARVATLPDLQLDVAVGADAGAAAPAAGQAAAPAGVAVPVDAAGADAVPMARPAWLWLALVFAALWLATLAWMLWSRRRATHQGAARHHAPASSSTITTRPTLPDLRRALDTGGFDEAVRMLQHMASPPASGLDEVIGRLDDPAQRESLDAMRRALWAGEGEPARARAALRSAFREGPRWKMSAPDAIAPLPPLYPPR